MNILTRTLSKIFKSSNQQELDKTKNLILDQEKVFYYVCQPHVQLNIK